MEVYLKLPYRDELKSLAGHFEPGCSVLELGCGTGRMTRPLLQNGHTVTAVDNSVDMLRYVPDAANKVCCDIEKLELGRAFDVVLFASSLINIADEALRRAQLAACRRHLSPAGRLLFQRHDPDWLREVQSGPFPSIGEVRITIERAVHHGSSVDMSVRYGIGEAEWKHHFTARVLDDDEIRLALLEAGFGRLDWIDRRWGVARH